jgi:hypothetical protein
MKTTTYKATIYIAGDLAQIEACCRRFCLRGLCVTVTPTSYVFTGGQESGAIVGLINYPRFPADSEKIDEHARALATELMRECCQRSCTVETPDESEWMQNAEIEVPR